MSGYMPDIEPADRDALASYDRLAEDGPEERGGDGATPRPFPAGARVRLRHDVDRYPHFIAPAGALGTVVDIGDPDIFAVRMDEPVPGAEDWDNEVHWFYGDDATGALEVQS